MTTQQELTFSDETNGASTRHTAEYQVPVYSRYRGILCEATETYPTIHHPRDVAGAAAKLADRITIGEGREILTAFYLDTRNKIAAASIIATGNVASNIVAPVEIFRWAFLLPAIAGIIISHNHPSGNPTPSAEDIQVTKQIIDASKLLGLKLVDHVITGEHGQYHSMAENTMMFV